MHKILWAHRMRIFETWTWRNQSAYRHLLDLQIGSKVLQNCSRSTKVLRYAVVCWSSLLLLIVSSKRTFFAFNQNLELDIDVKWKRQLWRYGKALFTNDIRIFRSVLFAVGSKMRMNRWTMGIWINVTISLWFKSKNIIRSYCGNHNYSTFYTLSTFSISLHEAVQWKWTESSLFSAVVNIKPKCSPDTALRSVKVSLSQTTSPDWDIRKASPCQAFKLALNAVVLRLNSFVSLLNYKFLRFVWGEWTGICDRNHLNNLRPVFSF